MYLAKNMYDTLPKCPNNARMVRINHAGLTKPDGLTRKRQICDLHKNHQILFVETKQTMMVKSFEYEGIAEANFFKLMLMMMIMGSYLSMGWLLLVRGGQGEAHLASGNIPVPAITTPLASPYDLHCNAQV